MVKTRNWLRSASRRRLELLCRLPGEFAGLRDERSAFRSIVDAAVKVVGVQSAHLALVDDDERTLYGVISSGDHRDDAPHIELHLAQAAAAQAALHLRKTIHIDRAACDPRVNTHARTVLSAASVAYLPLLSGGESFGLLILVATRARAWGAEDLKLARYCADIAAIAMENFRLLKRLAVSEERFRSLVEHIPAVVYTRDVEAPFRTRSISSAVEAMLGYSPREWQQDPELFAKLVHPEDMKQLIAIGEKAAKGGGFATTEYRMLDRKGETRWFRDEAVLVRDPAGQPIAWRGVAVDITAIRGTPAPESGDPPGRGRSRRSQPSGRLQV